MVPTVPKLQPNCLVGWGSNPKYIIAKVFEAEKVIVAQVLEQQNLLSKTGDRLENS